MISPPELLLFVAFMLFSGSAPILQLAAQTKKGCTSACGNLTISYLFGIDTDGSECYYEETTLFLIYCDKSTNPPTAYWSSSSSDISVVNISVENHEMLVKLRVASDCYMFSGERASGSFRKAFSKLGYFYLSTSKNRFFVVGCDSYAYFTGKVGHRFSTGWMSLCNNITDVTNGSCAGVGCCQTNFPRNMWAFNISLQSYYNHKYVLEFNPCSYAFVAADGYFNFSTASLKNIAQETMPAVLDWAIGSETCEVAQKNTSSYMCKENTRCTDADNGKGYRCHCKQGYSGNPYLFGPAGCQDIDECHSKNNPCNMTNLCTNLRGSFNCSCPKGYEGNGFRNGSGCTKKVRSKYTSRDIALGVGLGVGCGLLLLLALWALQKRKEKGEREKFFKENGGQRLEELYLPTS